jgi:hypothetical protein
MGAAVDPRELRDLPALKETPDSLNRMFGGYFCKMDHCVSSVSMIIDERILR